MPKISVITPVYNCQNFIKESLLSIINQSFQDFEMIVINDGSTDKTHEIVSDIKDDRLQYIYHDENKGVMVRSKEAIGLAKSKYIAVHDGDDVSLPNRLEAQYEFMECNPEIFCVGGFAKKIAVDGSPLGDWTFPPRSHEEIVSMLTIYRKSPIINPTAMFRLSGYDDLGGYSEDPTVSGAHDFDFWCRAILAGKRFNNLQDFLIKYRVNPDGMTRKKKVMQVASFRAILLYFMQRVKNVKL